MITNLEDLLKKVKTNKKKKIAVVAAGDREILELVNNAIDMQLGSFILIGDQEIIEKNIEKNLNIEIINEPDERKASLKGVELIKTYEAEAIMKGLLHTSTFLRAILNKEHGLNKGRLISQISVYDKEYGEGLQLLTDCAMAINPNLGEKKQIIENAIELAIKLGYDRPKVAILSALEIVNENISDTMDAAILSKMGDRGQIKNAIIDGPFALDNAISPEAAGYKGIQGEVAGRADILIVPNLQVGNVLTKALTYFARKDVAAAVMGADKPIIMTSRTDSLKNKLLSIALASYLS